MARQGCPFGSTLLARAARIPLIVKFSPLMGVGLMAWNFIERNAPCPRGGPLTVSVFSHDERTDTERLRLGGNKMEQDEEQLDGMWRGPVVREMPDRYGSVPGLEDDELADPQELEQMIFRQDWGPILDLPCRFHTGIRPVIDECGHRE